MVMAYKNFWLSYLVNIVIVISLLLTVAVGVIMKWDRMLGWGMFTYFIFGLSIGLPNVAMIVRRLRDSGKEWAFIFFVFIPLIGPIILLVFMCLPSKKNLNRPI